MTLKELYDFNRKAFPLPREQAEKIQARLFPDEAFTEEDADDTDQDETFC